MMQRLIIFCFFSIVFSIGGIAQRGYEIEVSIDNYNEKQIYLGGYYAEKAYYKDTAQVNDKGLYVFKKGSILQSGVYTIILPPKNKSILVLITQGDQKMKVVSDHKDIVNLTKVTGSPENKIYYDYLDFLHKRKKEIDPLQAALKAVEEDEKEKEKIESKIEKLVAVIKAEQIKTIEKNPKSLTASILKTELEPDIPEFEGTKDQIKKQSIGFRKKHFFDNIDMNDIRLLRSPFLPKRVNFFIDKLTLRYPDSVIQSIDLILEKAEAGHPDIYKHFLSSFLNKYLKPKIVGQDKVYIHIADNYYAKGKAPWADEATLKRIADKSRKLKAIQIGKKAPNIGMFTKDSVRTFLYDLEADFTVLFFWRPDCGHCKKATPVVLDVYEKFKDKGVKVYAACTYMGDKEKKCWKSVEDKKMEPFINVTDPKHISSFYHLYDVTSTPRIFILDKDKTIVMKQIGAPQLEKILNRLIREKELKEQKE